jgi:hypothetical protein
MSSLTMVFFATPVIRTVFKLTLYHLCQQDDLLASAIDFQKRAGERFWQLQAHKRRGRHSRRPLQSRCDSHRRIGSSG